MIANRGVVYLVGAGPGDPELLTLRAMRLIQQADTIVHDRLIPREALDWRRPAAQLIDVGKYPEHHRVSQTEINELLVHHARLGEIVVRLKGGDPFVFGRGQEEFEACRSASIPCFVVPGISSCIAGPSAAGIPVTSRGVARTFAVVTGQTDPNLKNDIDFHALSKMDTVVVLMGCRNLLELTTALIDAGRDARTPVACIENATLPNQRVVAGTLGDIAAQVEMLGLSSPMVSVIGDVAAMIDQDLVCLPTEIQSAILSP